jgi:1,4-dihydroxy-2-naphthoate octaprenyltransferase
VEEGVDEQRDPVGRGHEDGPPPRGRARLGAPCACVQRPARATRDAARGTTVVSGAAVARVLGTGAVTAGPVLALWLMLRRDFVAGRSARGATDAVAAGTTVSTYIRLGKFHVYQMAMPIFLAFTVVSLPALTSGRGVLTALSSLVTGWALVGLALTADDIVGFADGLDGRTFDEDRLHRPKTMKPLVLGHISYAGAVRFAGVLAAVAGAAGWVAGMAAPHRSLWVLGGLGCLAFVLAQYSAGSRVSYIPLGFELTLAIGVPALMLGPYYLFEGAPPAWVVVEALLLSVWTLLISWFSYCIDAEHDLASGRRTLAAQMGWPWMRRVLAATLVGGWVLVGVLAATFPELHPAVVVAALVPQVVVQVRQLRVGLLRQDLVGGRALGFRSHTYGAAGLILLNLVLHVV